MSGTNTGNDAVYAYFLNTANHKTNGQKTLLLNKFSYFICYCCRVLFLEPDCKNVFSGKLSMSIISHRFSCRDRALAAYTIERLPVFSVSST
jgi:hypothetical protein